MPETYVFNRTRLVESIERFCHSKVLLIGDVMLDEYLEGDTDRISPEAPIPIVRIVQSRLLLGGAGNVARNITALGGEAHLIGVCGQDAKGDVLQSLLAEESVSNGIISVKTRPTTLKTRVIARNQQMLRIDHEVNTPLESVEIAALLEAIRCVIDEYAVLLISDYGKGVVSEELMKGVVALRDTSRTKPRILVDPKTPNFSLYAGAYILTPNAKETSEAARLPVRNKEEILAAGKALFSNLDCDHVLTTLGAKGMALFLSPDEVWHIPTAAQKVFDVTGAGDTVIATLALALSANIDLLDSCVLANYAAGVVVADVGASVVANKSLRSLLASTTEPAITRWLPS